MSDNYHIVAALSEMSEGHQMYIELDGEEILLCQHEGEYFAINYFCSHAEFGLEGGSIRDGCITCPYHGAEFCLKDGSVQAPPAPFHLCAVLRCARFASQASRGWRSQPGSRV